MSHDQLQNDLTSQHEKPFLFTWNRRLRHLHGVSLRNVNTSITPPRLRGSTVSKDDAPVNLDSPTKRRLRTESQVLKHSHSSSDLTSVKKDRLRTPQKASTSYIKDEQLPSRPGGGRLRRRSTLHWGAASPLVRQQKLEDLAVHRLADTWFSLHSRNEHCTEPMYISEIMERSMNPDFAFFDLDGDGSTIARADECVVRVWARDATSPEYCLLVDLTVNLRSLQFVGKSLESFHHPLPQNCILFHLDDGIYTSFTDLPAQEYLDEPLRDRATVATETGSSFDALMQLANLDDCVQDALKVRAQIEDEINALLLKDKAQKANDEKSVFNQEAVTSTRSAATALGRQMMRLRKDNAEIRQSLQRRRLAAERSNDTDEALLQQQQTWRQQISELREDLYRTSEVAHGQMRRIGETLLQIFPIESLRNKALQFMIRNIHLPNSSFDDTNRDEIAAGLGFTARLVYQLSLYLSAPLPYPIDANIPESSIRDPISISLAQRKYPLHPTSVAYKFDYGVFLLNKDIECLMNKAGLRVLDIRHTLPNLKYLLYVLTAGSGELPARKAGGVRGLLGGGRLTPSISRRGSEESVQGHKEMLRAHNLGLKRNGSIISVGSTEEKAGKMEDPFSSTPRPLHHSGLRDGG